MNRNLIYYAGFGLLAAVLLVALWPTFSLVTPRWEVRVVDEAGDPVKGLAVGMDWMNTSADEYHLEMQLTDQNGYVVFPAHTVKTSALRRIANLVISAQYLYHGNFGPSAAVHASRPKCGGE
jgi:hypothetical protein